jgi:electron transfer flavoprotein beta subunit
LNIIVLIKQVPDMNAVRIEKGTGRPVLSDQRVISSYDEYAIEEALLLTEAHGGEVTVISTGPPSARDALTRALAMGADRGVLVLLPNVQELDTLAVAMVLAGQIEKLSYDLVLVGQNSDDYESGQVGPQVAELLNLPMVSSVMSLEVEGDRLVLKRDVEDGSQTVEAPMPALLMAITGLNEPRYPSLKGIMAAKKKPLDIVEPDATEPPRLSWSDPEAPERSMGGILVQDVPAEDAAQRLVAWLKEQKLIS